MLDIRPIGKDFGGEAGGCDASETSLHAAMGMAGNAIGKSQDMHHGDTIPAGLRPHGWARLEREATIAADCSAGGSPVAIWQELHDSSGNGLAIGEHDLAGDGLEPPAATASKGGSEHGGDASAARHGTGCRRATA